MVFYNYS